MLKHEYRVQTVVIFKRKISHLRIPRSRSCANFDALLPLSDTSRFCSAVNLSPVYQKRVIRKDIRKDVRKDT